MENIKTGRPREIKDPVQISLTLERDQLRALDQFCVRNEIPRAHLMRTLVGCCIGDDDTEIGS